MLQGFPLFVSFGWSHTTQCRAMSLQWWHCQLSGWISEALDQRPPDNRDQQRPRQTCQPGSPSCRYWLSEVPGLMAHLVSWHIVGMSTMIVLEAPPLKARRHLAVFV